jgi:hypothetical protein
MRFLKAYVETWGRESVIIPARCIGRFAGLCFDYQIVKCMYRLV